ncbi:MAG: hypothetical protein ACYTFP_04260 [Planctomycetota bacterium]|jgi:hypothetical protein
MIWISVTVCLLLAGLTAVWFSPSRGRLLGECSRVYNDALRKVSVFDRYRFSCHVEQFSDESQPVRQDQFFRVQDTNVQIEVLDVTDGQSHAHQVLSTHEQYRDQENSEFYLIQHNGVVPEKLFNST